MIICPICETENASGLKECILCAGELPEEIISPAVNLEAADTPEELPAINTTEPSIAEPTPSSVTETTPQHETSPIPNTDSSSLRSTTISGGQKEPPPPGTLCLIVYFNRQPALYTPVIYDELLIGRTDPSSNSYPDLDVTPFDPALAISRKHAYLYREGEDYYIYPISNSGTQVNQEMVDIGAKKKLKEGDVIILSGRLAIRFATIPANR